MKRMTTALSLTAVAATAFATYSAMTPPPAPKPVEITVEEYTPTWKCEDCSPEEKYVLAELQAKTKITDRNALATIPIV